MGMKVQRTITIDTDVNTWLKQNPQINASALINKFLKEHKEETKK